MAPSRMQNTPLTPPSAGMQSLSPTAAYRNIHHRTGSEGTSATAARNFIHQNSDRINCLAYLRLPVSSGLRWKSMPIVIRPVCIQSSLSFARPLRVPRLFVPFPTAARLHLSNGPNRGLPSTCLPCLTVLEWTRPPTAVTTTTSIIALVPPWSPAFSIWSPAISLHQTVPWRCPSTPDSPILPLYQDPPTTSKP